MDIGNWERRKSDIVLYGTNRELESQRLELYQANQWADQAQKYYGQFLKHECESGFKAVIRNGCHRAVREGQS